MISCDSACNVDCAGEVIYRLRAVGVCVVDRGGALGEGKVVWEFAFSGVDAGYGEGCRC